MAITYKQIASVTVGSGGAANIDLTSIPNTYTDLILLCSLRSANASSSDTLSMRFNNNSTASAYSVISLRGNGSTASSASSTDNYLYAGEISAANNTASTFASNCIYIPNYAGSTNKSVSLDTVGENNATLAYQHFIAGIWSNTSAITSIQLYPYFSTFVQYSTATLYGILKA